MQAIVARGYPEVRYAASLDSGYCLSKYSFSEHKDLYTMSTHAVDLGDDQLNDRVAAGVAAVDRLLHDEANRGATFVSDKAQHLSEAGVKRFRPIMSLLASEFGPEPGNPRVVKAATEVEMVHVATLYRDDGMEQDY